LFVEHWVRQYGIPESIVSDRDSRFLSVFWQSLFKYLDTHIKLSTAYHPQTDGQSERANQTLERMVSAYVARNQKDWDLQLPLCEFAYNNSENPSTGHTPFYLLYGQHPHVPSVLGVHIGKQQDPDKVIAAPATAEMVKQMQTTLDYARASLAKAQASQAEQANKRRRDVKYSVGDWVYLSTKHLKIPKAIGATKKFMSNWLGPYEVEHVSACGLNVTLHLTRLLNGIHPTFHVSLVKHAFQSDDQQFPDRPHRLIEPPTLTEGDVLRKVSEILNHRDGGKGGRTREYLVDYMNSNWYDSEWLPATILQDQYGGLIQKYKQDHPVAKLQGKPKSRA
jgi:hypothetical protein